MNKYSDYAKMVKVVLDDSNDLCKKAEERINEGLIAFSGDLDDYLWIRHHTMNEEDALYVFKFLNTYLSLYFEKIKHEAIYERTIHSLQRQYKIAINHLINGGILYERPRYANEEIPKLKVNIEGSSICFYFSWDK